MLQIFHISGEKHKLKGTKTVSFQGERPCLHLQSLKAHKDVYLIGIFNVPQDHIRFHGASGLHIFTNHIRSYADAFGYCNGLNAVDLSTLEKKVLLGQEVFDRTEPDFVEFSLKEFRYTHPDNPTKRVFIGRCDSIGHGFDFEAERALISSAGINIYHQLSAVVPEFFEGDYIIVKLTQNTMQPAYLPFKLLEPKVIASTHPDYPVLSVAPINEELCEFVRNGYNILCLPEKVRPNNVDEITLEEGPFDRLVMAEVNPNRKGFGIPKLFYEHDPDWDWGRQVTSVFDQDMFGDALKCYTSFVFVRQGEKPRDFIKINQGWNVISEARI